MPFVDQTPSSYGHTSQDQLQKRSIRAGFILWLRPDVDQNYAELYSTAGLNKGALNHPVVVIDALIGEPSNVQICMVQRAFLFLGASI